MRVTKLDPVLAMRLARQQSKLETGVSEGEGAGSVADKTVQLDPVLAMRLAKQQDKLSTGRSDVESVGSVANTAERCLDPTLAMRLARQRAKLESGRRDLENIQPLPTNSSPALTQADPVLVQEHVGSTATGPATHVEDLQLARLLAHRHALAEGGNAETLAATLPLVPINTEGDLQATGLPAFTDTVPLPSPRLQDGLPASDSPNALLASVPPSPHSGPLAAADGRAAAPPALQPSVAMATVAEAWPPELAESAARIWQPPPGAALPAPPAAAAARPVDPEVAEPLRSAVAQRGRRDGTMAAAPPRSGGCSVRACAEDSPARAAGGGRGRSPLCVKRERQRATCSPAGTSRRLPQRQAQPEHAQGRLAAVPPSAPRSGSPQHLRTGSSTSPRRNYLRLSPLPGGPTAGELRAARSASPHRSRGTGCGAHEAVIPRDRLPLGTDSGRNAAVPSSPASACHASGRRSPRDRVAAAEAERATRRTACAAPAPASARCNQRSSTGAGARGGPESAEASLTSAARDEAGGIRGSSNMTRSTCKAPTQIMQELQRALGSQMVTFRKASTSVLRCEKQSIRFEIEISRHSCVTGTYVVRCKRQAGAFATCKELCAAVLAESRI